jgi:hypothetical protein
MTSDLAYNGIFLFSSLLSFTSPMTCWRPTTGQLFPSDSRHFFSPVLPGRPLEHLDVRLPSVEVSSRITFVRNFLALPRAAFVGQVKRHFQMTIQFLQSPAPLTMYQPIRFVELNPPSSDPCADRAIFLSSCPETPFFSK